jgi:hypothetical protein
MITKLTTSAAMKRHLIESNGSCQFVSLISETEPSMRKTGNPFLGVKKLSNRTGLINANFVSSVRRKMVAAGMDPDEYVPGSTWQEMVRDSNGKATPVSTDKKTGQKFYLRFFPHKTKSIFVLDGKQIDKKDLKPFLTVSKTADFKPIFNTIEIRNIKEMKVRKVNLRAKNQAQEILETAAAPFGWHEV